MRLEKVILDNKVKASLLCGLDHYFTQPKLLTRWMHLGRGPRIKARVFSPGPWPPFHPKVLIVNSVGSRKQFAIVGSGNLSSGGLVKNIECSLYTDDENNLDLLRAWFQNVFFCGRSVTEDLINSYEPFYRKARRQNSLRKLGAVPAGLRKASNKRQTEKVRQAGLNFHVVNTNIKHHTEDHDHMLAEHEACAFNTPCKFEIERINSGDFVFLYQSGGPGIIAFGQAKGKIQKRDHRGRKLDAYCASLVEFRQLDRSIPPSEIQRLDNSGLVFRRAVEHIQAGLGQKLHQIALERSY